MAGYSQAEVTAALVRASEEMSRAVSASFGPDGGAVLAQSTTHLTITRSGGQILNLVFPKPDPVLSYLMTSATRLHEVCGDGVKGFVIVVEALLKQVAFKNDPCFVNKLLTLQTQLSQSFNCACGCVLSNDTLASVINTFFNTRFTQVVSEMLASLVLEWVLKLSSIGRIGFYISNFPLFCLKSYPFPVSASCIQDGFLFKGHWVRRLPSVVTRCILKVYYHSSEIAPEEGDVETNIKTILDQDNDGLKNILFVSNLFLPDRAQYLLNVKNVYFIHGICVDTAKFLYEQSLILGELVVECKTINEYLWLSVPVHQLLLKAPSNALSSEYAEGILDCLKMLNFGFKHSSCTVPGGGVFELALAKKLFNTSSDSCRRIPPVQSRKQLLSWRETLSEENDLLKHLDFKHLKGTDPEAVDTVCRALLCLQTKDNDYDNEQKCLEPVAIRMEAISEALILVANVCRMGGAIFKPKKGRLV